MTAEHRTLALADGRPGMCLAEAVVDAHGQVLVGQGCELTEALIQALSRRGVETVRVVQAAVVEAVEPAILHGQARARVAHLFRHATRQGRLNPLMHSVLQHRLGGAP